MVKLPEPRLHIFDQALEIPTFALSIPTIRGPQIAYLTLLFVCRLGVDLLQTSNDSVE